MEPVGNASLPWVDTAQMVEVDRAMMEDYQIGLKAGMLFAFHNVIRVW